jgi:hypothetical protein
MERNEECGSGVGRFAYPMRKTRRTNYRNEFRCAVHINIRHMPYARA